MRRERACVERWWEEREPVWRDDEKRESLCGEMMRRERDSHVNLRHLETSTSTVSGCVCMCVCIYHIYIYAWVSNCLPQCWWTQHSSSLYPSLSLHIDISHKHICICVFIHSLSPSALLPHSQLHRWNTQLTLWTSSSSSSLISLLHTSLLLSSSHSLSLYLSPSISLYYCLLSHLLLTLLLLLLSIVPLHRVHSHREVLSPLLRRDAHHPQWERCTDDGRVITHLSLPLSPSQSVFLPLLSLSLYIYIYINQVRELPCPNKLMGVFGVITPLSPTRPHLILCQVVICHLWAPQLSTEPHRRLTYNMRCRVNNQAVLPHSSYLNSLWSHNIVSHLRTISSPSIHLQPFRASSFLCLLFCS